MNPRAMDLVREDCAEVLQSQAQLLSPLRGDTLVVTGGTGFMGTWIAEMVACLNDQHGFGTRLHLIARSTDHFRATRPHLSNRRDITLVKSDVRHTIEFPKETNWLIHAAASPDTSFHATSPLETLSVIGEGTSSVLRAVDRCAGLKMLLNVSSSLVYGPQPLELERIPESFPGAPPCGSSSAAYSEAKRFAETFCAAARSQARIPTLTARPFAFLGPYQPMDRPWAINSFIREALEGEPIQVLGDGQTVRSYLYAADMALWLLRMLSAGTAGQILNLGSPEGVSLRDLAAMVASHFNPSPEIQLRTAPGRSQPTTRMVPDVSVAQKSLGLSLRVSLATAIERTITWNRLMRGRAEGEHLK